jgi:hypothetical protein
VIYPRIGPGEVHSQSERAQRRSSRHSIETDCHLQKFNGLKYGKFYFGSKIKKNAFQMRWIKHLKLKLKAVICNTLHCVFISLFKFQLLLLLLNVPK